MLNESSTATAEAITPSRGIAVMAVLVFGNV